MAEGKGADLIVMGPHHTSHPRFPLTSRGLHLTRFYATPGALF